MKAPIFFFALSGLMYSPAQASLGETEQQLITRYGPEIIKTQDKPGAGAVALDRVSFSKAGFTFDVLLFKGVFAEESVYHRPYTPMSDREIENLLKANSQGASWRPFPPQQEVLHWLHSERSWKRDDGSIANLEASKDKPRLLFHVQSSELAAAEKAAQ